MNNLSRKTIRNMLRKVYGNKGVRSRFEQLQIEKYGMFDLILIHTFNRKRRRYEKALRQRDI